MEKKNRLKPLKLAVTLALIIAAGGFLYWFLAPLSKRPLSTDIPSEVGRLDPKPMPMPEIVPPTGPPPTSVSVGAADAGNHYVPPTESQSAGSTGSSESGSKTISQTKAMRLISSAFGQNEAIPATYTCDGDNAVPPLMFADVPADAKSLVLVVDDPDAPSGTWVHWTVWNLPPGTTALAGGPLPYGAVEGRTSFGRSGYGGPCPPSGSTHRYFFRLFALDTVLNLPAEAEMEEVIAATEGHVLDKAVLVGTYARR